MKKNHWQIGASQAEGHQERSHVPQKSLHDHLLVGHLLTSVALLSLTWDPHPCDKLSPSPTGTGLHLRSAGLQPHLPICWPLGWFLGLILDLPYPHRPVRCPGLRVALTFIPHALSTRPAPFLGCWDCCEVPVLREMGSPCLPGPGEILVLCCVLAPSLDYILSWLVLCTHNSNVET